MSSKNLPHASAQTPSPEKLTAEERAQKEREDAQRDEAEVQASTSENKSIFQIIGDFFSFLLGIITGNNSDGPNEEGASAPDNSFTQKVALGKMVLDSKALGTWAQYQHAHQGEAVNFHSPVAGASVVTSGFGHRDLSVAGASHEHKGIDIGRRGADASPDIIAAADGIVLFAGRSNGYGNMVILGHTDGTTTLYGHMTGAKTPQLGMAVVQGQAIGEMGSTGMSTGTHVHFEVRKGGVALKPIIEGTEVARLATLVGHETGLNKLPVSNGATIDQQSITSAKPQTAHTVS